MENPEFSLSAEWQVVIFEVNGKANHAGLSIPGYGLADLSLLGARVVAWTAPSLPKGKRLYFSIQLESPSDALKFLQRPGLLTGEILKQEKACRGWHLTEDAPDFIRKLHVQRSKNPDDMNCVEWIVYALELGGIDIPMDVLTPTELLNWCQEHCQPVNDSA